MSAENCNSQENVWIQTAQELIDSILQDDRITECDKEELYELIKKKEENESVIHSITHQGLKDFIQNEDLDTPWFQEYKNNQKEDAQSWMTHMRDGIYEAIQQNPESYWKENTNDVQWAISYMILKSGASFWTIRDLLPPLTINGELFISDGTRLFSIDKMRLYPLDNILTIDTEDIITEDWKTFIRVQYESTRDITYVTLEGEEYFSWTETRDRIDPNSKFDINGITYFETKRNNKAILVSRNGETLFQWKWLDRIISKIGVIEYNGTQYMSVVEWNSTYLMSKDWDTLVQGEFTAIYNVKSWENNSLIVQGRWDDYEDKTIIVGWEALTPQNEEEETWLETWDSLLTPQEKKQLMKLHSLTELDSSKSFTLDWNEYFVWKARNQKSLSLYGAHEKQLGIAYSFKKIDLWNIQEQWFQTSKWTQWVQWIPVELYSWEKKWFSPEMPEREQLIDPLMEIAN